MAAHDFATICQIQKHVYRTFFKHRIARPWSTNEREPQPPAGKLGNGIPTGHR